MRKIPPLPRDVAKFLRSLANSRIWPEMEDEAAQLLTTYNVLNDSEFRPLTEIPGDWEVLTQDRFGDAEWVVKDRLKNGMSFAPIFVSCRHAPKHGEEE